MRSKLLQAVVLGLFAAAVTWAAWRVGWLQAFEHALWSGRVHFFQRIAPTSGQIKVILLDQASLDWGATENGWSWPWPRAVYGALVDFVRRGQPRALAFDVLYTEASAYGVEDDQALGSAIEAGPPFVAAVFLGQQTTQAAAWPEGLPRPPSRLRGVEAWLDADRAKLLVKPAAAFPVPEIAAPAMLLADVNDRPDRDGVFRRASLFGVFDGVAMPTLGFAAYLAGHREADVELREGALHLGGGRIPVDDEGRIILRFRGKSGTHQTFSAASIIQSELRLREGAAAAVDPAVFRDAYVFFGFSAPGLKDLRPTPVAGDYPGVEIHATVLDNLLAADALADVPRAWDLAVTVLLALAGAAATIYSRKTWQNVLAFPTVLAVPVVLGFVAYPAGYWWPMATGVTGAMLALVGGVMVSYATEGRQKRFLKSAFKQYLGEAVIDQIIADPTRLKLGGERKQLTMFFSDLEKFSSFSEKLEPPQLIDLLNAYLSDVGRVIIEEGGYLDKFIGDAIVAFWNAPLAQPDHAARAVRAALRCQRLLRDRQADLSRMAAGMPVRMRIGLNTGDVVVGNMGSQDRFNYTMLGDAANLASRLEGANKAFGTFILVAETTWAQVKGAAHGRELGALRVVGRKAPVRVFEAVALGDEERPAWLDDFEHGLNLVKERRWADARAVFAARPDDPPSAAYVRKLQALLDGAESDWDGVWGLTEK
jgi:adenylate cyclase